MIKVIKAVVGFLIPFALAAIIAWGAYSFGYNDGKFEGLRQGRTQAEWSAQAEQAWKDNQAKATKVPVGEQAKQAREGQQAWEAAHPYPVQEGK